MSAWRSMMELAVARRAELLACALQSRCSRLAVDGCTVCDVAADEIHRAACSAWTDPAACACTRPPAGR